MERTCPNCVSNERPDTINISVTPAVLVYFAEKKKGTRKDVTNFVFEVAKRLEGTAISVNAVFRGELQRRRGDIWSETVDDELWYWLSNQFLKESPSNDAGDVYFMQNKSLENYRLDKIGDNLHEIRWPSDSIRENFLNVLREVISLESKESKNY